MRFQYKNAVLVDTFRFFFSVYSIFFQGWEQILKRKQQLVGCHCRFHFKITYLNQDFMQSPGIDMCPFKVLHWLRQRKTPQMPKNPQNPHPCSFQTFSDFVSSACCNDKCRVAKEKYANDFPQFCDLTKVDQSVTLKNQ